MKKRKLNITEVRRNLISFLKSEGIETWLETEKRGDKEVVTTNELYALLPDDVDPVELGNKARESGIFLWENPPDMDKYFSKPPARRPTIEELLETEDSVTYIPRYTFTANVELRRRVYNFNAGIPQVVPSRDVPELDRRQAGIDEQRDPTIISRDGNIVEKRVSHGTTDGWDVHYPKGKPSIMEYV